jgi:energy-coupling factor transporter ATP-binding protein EcfA2
LFGDVWAQPELTPRGRSLIICAALINNGSTEQLRGHLARAKIPAVRATALEAVFPRGDGVGPVDLNVGRG